MTKETANVPLTLPESLCGSDWIGEGVWLTRAMSNGVVIEWMLCCGDGQWRQIVAKLRSCIHNAYAVH